MRILVVSAFWPTPDNPISGIFVVQQVQAYVEAGCEVTVIAPQSYRGPSRSRYYRQQSGGVEVFSPSYPDVPQSIAGGPLAVDLNTRSCARAIGRTIARHGLDAKLDGIHVHDIRYCALSHPYWAASISAPALVTLHGVDPFVQARVGAQWFLQRLSRLWEGIARIVLVGAPLRSYARSLGAPEQKTSIVHNGSDIPLQWNARQRPLSERRVVLSVSNLVELKGIDLNLRALARIRREHPDLEWQYRIVGDGPESAKLRDLARDLGIDDRVKFLGRLGHEPTLAEIASCDVFSLPSWGENFGIVYLEAMGRGRPVIGCRGWGAAEMVRDQTDGLLVEPKDVCSLATALEALIEDPARCEQIGRSARQQSEEFSWERNVRSHLALMARDV